MIALVKGQKVDLTKAHPQLSSIKLGLGWDVSGSSQNVFDLDAVALLIDASGKIISDKHVIYYNNLRGHSVSLSKDNRTGAGGGNDEEVSIKLDEVPADIEKIILAITIYDASDRKQTFGKVRNGFVTISNENTKQEIYKYDLGNEFSTETAVIVGEIYRYKGEWKFGAVGSGLEGELKGLCEQFGLTNLPSSFYVKAASPVNNNSTIKLSKIELKKSGDTINLSKTSKTLGEILVNLNWNQQNSSQSGGGFLSSIFGTNKSGVDLDLGCLFEFKDGFKGVIQPLGNVFGSYMDEPYVHLDKDDRTGASTNGENMKINGNKIYEFERILIFAYIYDGAANWSQVDGIVTIKQQDSPEIVVRMDEHRNGFGMCAIAMFENINDETFKVEKLVKYFRGHQEMDRHYRWNLNWVAGSK
ncbi:TerD family protein [Metabacillus fastidiosus]|uniref:TerD family protein n=1 Tax=Metabacillus fastidiosus TaxID=1458 RepID=UPI002E22FA04|nr:TerD family protein [Metabacillus fastidiosus]